MQLRQWLRFAMILVGALLTGCAGGRGSSGFDVTPENAAITTALATRQCVEVDGLQICPANESSGSTPSASPTPAASGTPASPPPVSATPVPSPTAPRPLPRVDTTVTGTGPIDCIQEPNGACRFTLVFTPLGFPAAASFRVAGREPNGLWQISTMPIPTGDADTTTMEASVLVASTHGGPPSFIQFAVLVFQSPHEVLPLEVQMLAETGADSAFVTPTFSVAVIVTPPLSNKGPQMTYLGIARSDHVPIAPTALDTDGRPVYVRSLGAGMELVVEARRVANAPQLGTEVFDPAGGLPDLQVIVSQPLGDGSPAVCDITPPHVGGVPATVPLEFSDAPAVVSAINDLGCRADGARTRSDNACTTPDAATGEFEFVAPSSMIQYCLEIDGPWAFAAGDTIVAARVRDIAGAVSAPQEIVIRVVPPPPRT